MPVASVLVARGKTAWRPAMHHIQSSNSEFHPGLAILSSQQLLTVRLALHVGIVPHNEAPITSFIRHNRNTLPYSSAHGIDSTSNMIE